MNVEIKGLQQAVVLQRGRLQRPEELRHVADVLARGLPGRAGLHFDELRLRAGAAADGLNVARYCNKSVDQQLAKSDTLPFGSERDQLLQGIQQTVVSDAAGVGTMQVDWPAIATQQRRGSRHDPDLRAVRLEILLGEGELAGRAVLRIRDLRVGTADGDIVRGADLEVGRQARSSGSSVSRAAARRPSASPLRVSSGRAAASWAARSRSWARRSSPPRRIAPSRCAAGGSASFRRIRSARSIRSGTWVPSSLAPCRSIGDCRGMLLWTGSASFLRRSGWGTHARSCASTRMNSRAASCSVRSSRAHCPCEPALVIADEPTSALDVIVQARVLETFLELVREVRAAVILVSHDMGAWPKPPRTPPRCTRARSWSSGRRRICLRPRGIRTSGRCSPRSHVRVSNRERLFSIPGQPPQLPGPLWPCAFAPRCRSRRRSASSRSLSPTRTRASLCLSPSSRRRGACGGALVSNESEIIRGLHDPRDAAAACGHDRRTRRARRTSHRPADRH